jgi:hypothetical protein
MYVSSKIFRLVNLKNHNLRRSLSYGNFKNVNKQTINSILNNFKKENLFSNKYNNKNIQIITREFNSKNNDKSSNNAFWYALSGFVLMVGASYAAVPLFKIFCESQGIEVNNEYRDKGVENLKEKLSSMKKRDEHRQIKVQFVASTSSDLLWKFSPSQEEITVNEGDTALAFFRAKNLTDRPIIGIGKIKNTKESERS